MKFFHQKELVYINEEASYYSDSCDSLDVWEDNSSSSSSSSSCESEGMNIPFIESEKKSECWRGEITEDDSYYTEEEEECAVCRDGYNDESEDAIDWPVICDTCFLTFHLKCVGLSEQPKDDEEWNCNECRGKDATSRLMKKQKMDFVEWYFS